MFEAWNWPQWAVFGWWVFVFFLQYSLMLAGKRLDYKRVAAKQTSIIVMAFVLYMGGFWS